MLDMFALPRYYPVLELASTVDDKLPTSAIHKRTAMENPTSSIVHSQQISDRLA